MATLGFKMKSNVKPGGLETTPVGQVPGGEHAWVVPLTAVEPATQVLWRPGDQVTRCYGDQVTR